MKDKESKPLIKSARKTARMAIQLRIVTELKVIAKEFGQDSENLINEIEKGAKKLAKKISGELKITAPAAKSAPKETKPVKAAAKPKAAPKESKPVKAVEKPAPKAAAKPGPVVTAKKAAAPVKAVNGAAKKVTAKPVAAKPEKKTEPAKTKAPAKKS